MRLSDLTQSRRTIIAAHKRHVLLVGMLVLAVAVTGCVTVPPANPPEWPETQPPRVVLTPGDILRIQFVYWPELDEEQTIRADGKIQMKLIGAVQAAGLTPEEFQADLVKRYEDKIINPEIALAVDSSVRRMVYVSGEVLSPGMILMEGELTALEAIQRAGGVIKWSARTKTVVIVRKRDGKQYARTINMKKAFQDPTSEPFYLEPLDIVFVPRTKIEKVDQWVDEYVNKIIPRNMFLHFNKSLDEIQTKSSTYQVQTGIK